MTLHPVGFGGFDDQATPSYITIARHPQMAKELQLDYQQALELALDPLREAISLVGQTTDALREAIEDRDSAQFEQRAKSVESAVARCKAHLDARMASFEKRLFAGLRDDFETRSDAVPRNQVSARFRGTHA